ncbi:MULTISPECIES: RNA polymerase sigma-70 factor [unclassified Chitinophaga]|uniref:RNA polymerase sigma-70 factor n=1 Tax=unclassified Chitinophaga TaxID=2619133 RepID=UPI0030101DF3
MGVDNSYTDEELIQLLQTGNEPAFNLLFERYRDKLYYYLITIVKAPEIAEEIVTDIFVKFWIGKELLHNIRNLESFLHKVAYHKALDFLRTTARHARLQQIYIDRQEPAFQRGADELLIDAECRQLLLQAINQLPPQRKLIYAMSREQGLTHRQIAEALRLSPSTVKNSMVAATRSISDFLRRHHSSKAALNLFFIS